ncbi:hypothetical protein GCM10011507_20270 [Edaphobacter acidisoli]|uniref:Zinc-finger domain-containing protein n=1 Tax=Edaphobacter acidisoli TaxID=2040573 RepID=A0A916W5Q2_9BACT|nr:hypothetical protein [Edaphobacter acidisoli]GGA68752.1 hypothetical protein GCM10011507_20270 [Edaphobacter acidisoli]
MKHFTEEELIAYQLHESDDENAIRRHLDTCGECAAVSDSIAETLRIFSANPVPQPNLEHNWQRLRGNLRVLAPESKSFRWTRWVWPTIGLMTAALVLIAAIGIHSRRLVKPNYAINGRGPLTTQPVDPNIANHIDAAERLLTEVNNTQGPLDSETRDQAHALLLTNAVYVRQARNSGDLAEAAVLDDLGRVLTTLDNEPPTPESAWRLRIEMNTSGLLFDLRVLHQNDTPTHQQQGTIQ